MPTSGRCHGVYCLSMSNPLQQLVKDRMAELDLSFREAARRSGGKVSSSTLNNIAIGRQGKHLDDSTLQGIALALDVSQSKVRAVAGTSPDKPVPIRWPKDVDRLTDRQRRAVLDVITAFLDDSP
jgi:hypothetical protein